MTSVSVVRILPQLCNMYGDAENARVIVERMRWAGIAATITDVNAGDSLPSDADAIVIGGSADSALEGVAELLRHAANDLRSMVLDDEVPCLAIGSGWELLGERVTHTHGRIAGAAILDNTSQLHERVADDLVLDTSFGRLAGFQNTDRTVTGSIVPLGTVLVGRGNHAAGEQEGQLLGGLVATSMQGPVCARNPRLADSLIDRIVTRRDLEYRRNELHDRVDTLAKSSRAAILDRHQLPSS